MTTSTLVRPSTRRERVSYSSNNQWSRLALGSAGKFLRSDGTDLAYSTLTLPNAATAGHVLYATGTDTIGTYAPVAAKVTLTGGDVTTTSTSLVDLTGVSITMTTKAARVLLTFTCTTSNSTQDVQHTFNVMVDGALQLGTNGMAVNVSDTGGSENDGFSMTYLTDVLSAGSHTFKVQWKVSAGTGTVQADAGNPVHFAAVELLAIA